MKKYIAEFIGTLVLVLVACGVAAVSAVSGSEFNVSYLMTALSFGLVIVAMAYSVGNISGCHINPAVSFAMLINKKITVKDFIGYVIAQFAGATVGALILSYLAGTASGLGANALASGDVVKSLVVEVILTFIFVWTILGVTSKEEYSPVAGLVIGFALVLVHLLGIHFTGTSVNPARSFGPALFVQGAALSNLWVFIVGPMVGAGYAALSWKCLSKEEK